MRRPRSFCLDPTTEVYAVVFGWALRSRALRISIAAAPPVQNVAYLNKS
jgi:hypothetical protein